LREKRRSFQKKTEKLRKEKMEKDESLFFLFFRSCVFSLSVCVCVFSSADAAKKSVKWRLSLFLFFLVFLVNSNLVETPEEFLSFCVSGEKVRY